MAFSVRARMLACALTVAALGAAGCGSDDDSSDSASTPAAATTAGTTTAAAGTDDGVAKAKAAMEAAMSGETKLPTPPDTIDPGKGKAGVITCAAIGEGCSAAAKQAREALLAMGWSVPPVSDGKFTPAVQSGLIEQYVRDKVDVIVMSAVDPSSVKAAIDKAAAAKIPVVCLACVTPPEFKDSVIDVGTGGEPEGKNLGYWAVAASGGKAKLLTLEDKGFPIVVKRVAATKAAIEETCPACDYSNEQISAADVGKPGPPWFTALLSSKPKGQLGYILTPYDAASLPVGMTAQQRGRTELVVGSDGEGDKGVLEAISKDDTPLKMTSVAPFNYMGWAGADLGVRKKLGLPLWDATGLPAILVTKDNVADYIGNTYAPAVATFKPAFLKSWGK
jgi:ABC-type sugar transport system substrate-binding protein